MLMKAEKVEAGDVYTDKSGSKFMVRAVKPQGTEGLPSGYVALRLSAGRTDYGGYYEFHAYDDLEIYRP